MNEINVFDPCSGWPTAAYVPAIWVESFQTFLKFHGQFFPHGQSRFLWLPGWYMKKTARFVRLGHLVHAETRSLNLSFLIRLQFCPWSGICLKLSKGLPYTCIRKSSSFVRSTLLIPIQVIIAAEGEGEFVLCSANHLDLRNRADLIKSLTPCHDTQMVEHYRVLNQLCLISGTSLYNIFFLV